MTLDDRWIKLKTECEQCHSCPALVRSRKTEAWGKPVYGSGNINSKIVFVGEAPGRLGAGRTGTPFLGDKSGDFLDWCLTELGLDHEDIYITNIVKCLPKNEKGNNRKPSNFEVNQCMKHLVEEMGLIKPEKIICLGKTAYKNIMDKTPWYPAFRTCEIIYLEHPSYIYNYQGGKPGTKKASDYVEKMHNIILGVELS